jgi:hypothetical protein
MCGDNSPALGRKIIGLTRVFPRPARSPSRRTSETFPLTKNENAQGPLVGNAPAAIGEIRPYAFDPAVISNITFILFHLLKEARIGDGLESTDIRSDGIPAPGDATEEGWPHCFKGVTGITDDRSTTDVK